MLFGVCWESSHPLCWTFPSCLVINMDGGGWILCTWAEGLRGLERWDVAGFHFLESEFWVAAAQWCLKNCLVRLCKEPVLIYADYCSLFSAQALLTSWVKTSSSLMVKCQAVGLYHPQTSRGISLVLLYKKWMSYLSFLIPATELGKKPTFWRRAWSCSVPWAQMRWPTKIPASTCGSGTACIYISACLLHWMYFNQWLYLFYFAFYMLVENCL